MGTWRAHKRGKSVTITVTSFDALAAWYAKAIQDEAALIAPLRGPTSVEVLFDDDGNR